MMRGNNSLTPLGMEFSAHIKQLIAWARAIIPAVRVARDSYANRNSR